MKLVIINGSPRGKESNSNVIANWIAAGIVRSIQVKKINAPKYNTRINGEDSPMKNESLQIDKFYLSKINTQKEAVELIEDNSTVLVVFPLYADAMPAITKLFFEKLEVIANKKENIKIYFIVHSGFEGANHCRAIERYLIYLTDYLGFKYMGATIKPGSEGFRLTPEEYILETKDDFLKLAEDIAKGKTFGINTVKRLAGFEFPPEAYKQGIKDSKGNTGYFSTLLKQNNAFDKCFDKPYQREKIGKEKGEIN